MRSVLFYGCSICASASATQLGKLETVQYSALKICVGAMNTTRKEDVVTHCGELPVSLFILQAQLKSFLKIKYNPSAADDVALDHWANNYGHFRKTRTLIYNQAHDFINQLPDMKILGYRTSLTPPWLRRSISIDTSLRSGGKKAENPVAMKAAVDALTKTLAVDGPVLVYTDALITDHQTGIGMVFVEYPYSMRYRKNLRLNNNISMYKVEPFAILKALVTTTECWPERRLVLFTDSLSNVISLNNGHSNTNPNMLIDIYSIAATVDLKIVWIPSHIGCGNEAADSLAKEASLKSSIE